MTTLRVLILEDNADDAALICHELRQEFDLTSLRIESEKELLDALELEWDLVVSDYNMPSFTALRALEIIRPRFPDLPVIVVSGTIREDTAVDAMRSGANDYVMKDSLARLVPAIRRELIEAHVHAEQRALSNRLQAMQERLRVTFEQAPVGIVVAAPDGRALEVNDRICRMVGLSREEMVGRHFRDFTRPEDLPQAEATFRAVLQATGAIRSFEGEYRRSDGSAIWSRLTLTGVAAASPTPEYVIAMIEDISESRSAEERLRFQSYLLDCVQQSVIATDIDGRITYWNRFAEQLYGWTAAEALGRHILDITPAGISASMSADILERLQRGESWSGEVTLQRRDGRVFTGWVTDSPIVDASGAMIGIVGVSQEITEKKKAEESLRASEQRYRELVESAHEGIAIIGRDGIVTFINAAMTKIFGYGAGEIVGRQAIDFVHPDDRDGLTDRDSFRQRDIRLVHHNGSVVWTITSRAMLPDGAQLVMIMDITDRKAAENELRRREEQLERAQRIAGLGSWEQTLPAGRLVWSPEFYDLYGIDPSAEPDLHVVVNAIHPDDRGAFEDFMASLRAGRGAFVEHRVLLPDGRLRTLLARGEAIADESGNLTRILGFVQDITDQKSASALLRRHSAQQEAIARVSEAALMGASLQQLFEVAVSSVGTVLDADRSEVLERTEHQHYRIAAAHGWPGAQNQVIAVTDRSGIAYSVRTGEAFVSRDMTTDPRFTPLPTFLSAGLVSGVAAPLKTRDGRILGVLAAQSLRPGTFNEEDMVFVQSVANVIAQTIARNRSDSELRSSAEQQIALAQFTRRALGGISRQLLDDACTLLMEVLDIEFASMFELDAAGGVLSPRAGQSFRSDPTPLPADARSQVGYSLNSDAVVLVNDYATETRFPNADFVEYGITAGMTVAIRGRQGPFGSLGAFTRSGRQFSPTDARFIQSLANALAEAMERDIAQRALVESEQRYREVVEGAGEVIYAIDMRGNITALNRAFGAVTGWRREEWMGRQFLDLVAPADRARAAREFQRVLSGESVDNVEFTLRNRDDTSSIVQVSVAPVFRGHTVTGLHGFGRDVTREKLANAERDRVARDLQLLLQSTEEGVIALDSDGVCTLVNRSATDLLSDPGATLVRKRVHQAIHPQCGGCAITRVLDSAHAERVHEEVFVRSDGLTIPVEFAVAPIVDAGIMKGAVITFTDITQRLKLEGQLEQATRLTSLGRMAATIAHEFNNVLMGISPFVEILKRPATPEERKAAALEHMSAAVQRGKRITQEILRYTRPTPPVIETVDVDQWSRKFATEAISLLGPRYDVEVRTAHRGLALLADPSQLHQIFSNLLLNARDAMPDGGAVTIEFQPGAPGEHFAFGIVPAPENFLHVIVEDRGSGIAPDILRHVFEPLFTTKRNGTGLGLAVTHQVVKQHGGEIFAESEVGRGSRFHVFIPRANQLESAPESSRAATGRNSIRRVLLVEDDVNVATGVALLLREEGIEVEVVTCGADAMPAIARAKPDAIILDIGLPDMDGTRVYAEVAASHPELPVVFSTGHGDERKIEPYLDRGNVAMLLKPYEITVLLDTLQRLSAACAV